MGKRPSGDGTVHKRGSDRRWAGAVTLQDGRRVWRYGKTQQEVMRKLAAVKRDRDAGLPIVAERRTVADYLTSWLEMSRPSLRPDVLRNYTWYVEHYILPTLGRVQLAKLSAEHVQRLIAELSAAERKPERLAPSTVHTAYKILRAALNQAVMLNIVPRNVALLVKRPRVGRKEMHCWDPQEALAFLDAARRHDARHYALYVVALTTGLRPGELLALRWRDVTLVAREGGGEDGSGRVEGTLRVQNGLHWRNEEDADGELASRMSLEEVKTAMSRRQIQLSTFAAAALLEHRHGQAEERAQLGDIWRDHDLVFTNTIGGAIRANILRRRSFLRLVKLAGVPRIRLYDTRHTAATTLLIAGVHPKIVSEMLGHSSVAITLSIYSHVLPMIQGAAAAAMDRLLGAPASQGGAPSGLLGGLVEADPQR